MTRFTIGPVISAVLIGLGGATAGGEVEPVPSDPWAPVRALEGTWKGQGEGFGQTSEVTHEWRFVMGGTFLRLETRSVARSETGDGEVHEDVGFVSWSSDDSVLRFRQFLSEGYVNTYRAEVAVDRERSLNFEPEASEGAGGMLARLTFTFLTDDSYEVVLALGRKGQEFKACQTMRMHRVD
jgi:hypothetical protein